MLVIITKLTASDRPDAFAACKKNAQGALLLIFIPRETTHFVQCRCIPLSYQITIRARYQTLERGQGCANFLFSYFVVGEIIVNVHLVGRLTPDWIAGRR